VENSEKSLGTKNPGSADIEISVNKNSNILGIKHPESAEVEISVNINRIYNRTDIKGEINLTHDNPIYGKQYPHALSVTDFVNG